MLSRDFLPDTPQLDLFGDLDAPAPTRPAHEMTIFNHPVLGPMVREELARQRPHAAVSRDFALADPDPQRRTLLLNYAQTIEARETQPAE